MADQIENEDEVLELGEAPADTLEGAEGADIAPPAEAEEEPELPTFADAGDEEPTDTDLVKHLRSELRKSQAKAKELETGKAPEPAIVVGEKPTLESCEWDEEKFETELDAYKDRVRQADAQANKGQEEQQAAIQQWEAEKSDYMKKRTALPFKPETIDDAETTVAASLDPHQIAIIVKSANNAPALNLALSRHPSKLAAIAGIKDYVKFTAAVVRLEAEVKMGSRKPTAQPDTPVRGAAPLSRPNGDPELARLEKEAERTQDRSKVVAYKRKLREDAQQAA